MARNEVNEPENRDYLIRTLRDSDLPRLIAMDSAILGHKRSLYLEHKLKRALKETDVCVSVGAEFDGTLVGALMLAVHFGEFGVMEPVAVLDTVLVDPHYAGLGIASAMLDQVLINLSGLRIAKLRTEVAWNEHDLIAFFDKSGFKPMPMLVLEREI